MRERKNPLILTSQNQSLSKIYKLAFQIILMRYQTQEWSEPNTTYSKIFSSLPAFAVIAGADGWEEMENYGISKLTWLQKFLKLPNGIPSDDTFRRVLEKLEPKILEQKLRTWINQLIGSVAQEVIPIDGKSLRGYYDRTKGVKNLHLVLRG